MRSNDIIPETLEGLESGGGHLRKQGLLLNTHLSKGKGAIAPLLPQVPPALLFTQTDDIIHALDFGYPPPLIELPS